jgi:hypothetical protein
VKQRYTKGERRNLRPEFISPSQLELYAEEADESKDMDCTLDAIEVLLREAERANLTLRDVSRADSWTELCHRILGYR